MSLYSEYMALRKKRLEEESKEIKSANNKATSTASKKTGSTGNKAKTTTKASGSALLDDYLGLREDRIFKNTDFAPVVERVKSRMTTDIAPVKKKENGWFQKGAFEDGYDFGDVTRVILGTTADVGQDLIQGAVGIGEKAIDFFAVNAGNISKGMYYQNGGGYNVEADKMFEESIKASQPMFENFAKKDIINEEKISRAIISGDYEKQSVLAEKADQTVQSGGQLLGTLALQGVGVPWWVTTGATAWGAEAENALNQGATMEEANLSGAVSAGAEILTEKISGGIKFGGKALDDALTNQIARGISNKFMRKVAKLIPDALGEGFEEVVSQDISSFGQWLSYRDEEELKELLFSEEAMDEKIDAFIGGALMGGVSNVGNAIISSTKGIDSVTGRTNNEEAVVRKVYEDLVAEAKKDGKVTAKEKTKIYDRVTRELEKGGISTDTIEELLDEEGYKAYQAEKDNFFNSDIKKSYDDAITSEAEQLKELQKKLDELTDASNTVGNNRLYDEVVSKMTELQENPGSKAIKEQLDNEVKRINQMHNDLRTKVHDMVRGTKLEESYNELVRSNQKYEVDLNQYKNKHAKKTIENILKSGMGDNTTHFHEYADWLAQISADKGMSFSLTNNEALNGTEHDFSAEGLTTNGFVTEDGITLNMDSPKALNSTVGHEVTHVLEQTELYQTLQDTVFKYEIAKNGQEAFDKRLKALEARYKGKNADAKAELTADLVGDYLFTDYDFVHNLSTENRNVFQKIYDEIKYLCKVVTAGSKEARELEKVKKVFEDAYRANVKGKAETNYSLSDSTGKELTKEQQEYFKDSKMRDENGNLKVMYHGSQDAGFHVFDSSMSDDGTSFFFVDRNDVAASYSGTTETYEAKTIRSAEDMNNFLAEIGYDQYEAVEKNGKFELLENNEHVAWSNTAQGIYEEFCWYEGVGEGDANYKVYLNLKNPLEVDSKGRPWNKIDAEFSQEVYDKFQSLTAEEKAALIDLAEWEDFRLFNSEIQEARDNELASAYAKLGEDANIYDIFSVAADNFSEESLRENSRKYLKTRDYAQRAKEQGYDGVIFKNIVDNGGYSNGSEGASTVAIAFDSNQIKSVANERPTGNKDIRYSLSDTNGRELSTEQNEYFKDSKARDENGNLQVVYHGTRNADFTVFKRNATYFTDNKEMADSYAPSGEMFEGYVNITKPYEIDAQGEKWSKIPIDAEMKKFLQEYGSSVFKEGGKWRTSTADIVAAIEEAVDNGDMDYDGIVIKNIDDTGTYHKGKATNLATDYIVFNSNQFKNADNKTPTSDSDIRYSLMEYTAEEKTAHNKAVLDHFGKTYKWAETGYLLLDGSKLDMSGKHEGAPGGYRTVDHRDISDALGDDYGGDSYSGSLVQFMGEGNIRIIPECNGINLSVKPTKAQEMALSDFVSRARGEVILDIDGLDGYTEVSVEYPRGTHANKVLNDIRAWFDNGTKPEVSNLSQFRSLSKRGANPKEFGDWNVYGNDFGPKGDDFAPVIPTPNRNVLPGERMSAAEMFPDEPDISQAEYDNLVAVKEATEARLAELAASADFNNPDVISEFERINAEWVEASNRLVELESELSDTDRVDSLMDAEAPPEMDAPYYESNPTTLTKKATADIVRDVRASLGLNNTQMADAKAIIERYRTGEIRTRDQLITELQDKFGTFVETETNERLADVKRAIRTTRINVSDTIKHGIADYARVMQSNRGRILFAKNGLAVDEVYKELQEQFPDFFNEDSGMNPEDQLLHIIDVANTPHVTETERRMDVAQVAEAADMIINGIGDFKRNQALDLSNKESKGAFESLMRQADKYAPMDDIGPVKQTPYKVDFELHGTPYHPGSREFDWAMADKTQSTGENSTPNSTVSKKESVAPVKPAAKQTSGKVAQTLTTEPKKPKKVSKWWSAAKEHLLDNGMVFEDMSKKTGNRKLEAKWNFIRNSQSRAQRLIGKGTDNVKSLNAIRKQVTKSGKTEQFYDYLYHRHNIGRMTLEDRFGTPNKAVFGDSVTAKMSSKKVQQYEQKNPEFKEWAKDVYGYMNHLRGLLVKNGVISQETATLWQKMYPCYVPIGRVDQNGANINVPLDTNKTGINAPVKRATGGNSDIRPLFDVMAERTLQTYRAIAKNNFGVELKNTLNSTIAKEAQTVDGVIDSLSAEEGLLKAGANGMSPTFTVFENGERVEFEITDEMYEAMKPTSDFFSGTSKVLSGISKFRRGTLTEYNPWFLMKNAIKDQQDIILNSQHPVKTYANMPVAIAEMVSNGEYYQEYLEAGGEQNTYFDNEDGFDKNKAWEAIKWATGLNEIAWANNKIEMLPRLAEFIASRKSGQSIEVAMLDAARVTTNFAAGGDAIKWANRNGVTFLNASVQGAVQQARNIREAKMNGLKGWAGLAARYLVAGLPVVLLNNLIWEDDEEYEELADYVKRDYYIVGKFDDGKFVRIPKGRGVAVIQDAFEQMDNLRTGDDEVDLKAFLELVVNNLAPNNPLDNNVTSPVVQVLKNTTWYGEDLVPSRLQEVPAVEQYDESTDDISRWIGEKTNSSPMKWNYLLDQYSGVLGDTFLPMFTPEAESGDDTTLGTMTAPLRDMFTTDSVINNQTAGDFYDLKDQIDISANSSKATEEDKMKSTYLQAVGWELSDLYKQKREIQNSSLADSAKYKQSRDIQKQINEIMQNAMGGYEDVSINGLYSEVGDKRFNLDSESGKWYEIKPKNADGSDNWFYQKEQEVTKALGISYNDYWNNRDEYNYAYDNPEKYTVAKAVGGYESFRSYTSDLWDIKADKDENGKSINGSRKEKVIDYVNNMDADYGEKIILFKSEYNADDTYNEDIIEYLNSREDISYQEMETVLKYLGFEVDSQGNISW
jgi:hypothetical protein